MTLKEAVQLAAKTFREYQRLHLNKAVPDIHKAGTNAMLAEKMEAALKLDADNQLYAEATIDELLSFIDFQIKFHDAKANTHILMGEPSRAETHLSSIRFFNEIKERLINPQLTVK